MGGRLITSMEPLSQLPWEEEEEEEDEKKEMEKKREGKGGKWRKSETREEMRGKGRETTRHFESSVEWFGSRLALIVIVRREGGLIL